MVGGGGRERTNWTPYIIYFLAAAQAGYSTYYSGRSDDQKAMIALETRIAAMENTVPLYRRLTDQQIQDIVLRLQRQEDNRR